MIHSNDRDIVCNLEDLSPTFDQVKQKVLGARHPDAANTLFHLAEVIRAQGKTEAAITLLQASSHSQCHPIQVMSLQ